MKIFPAIDIVGCKAVRLVQGDYGKMTVYSDDPPAMARSFFRAGAEYLHVVDLEGARDGDTANITTVKDIIEKSGLLVQVGGGVRSEAVVRRYLDAGAMRVILGTAAITKPGFVADMVKKYGEKIAVGVDVRDGMVAIKGWTEISEKSCFDFCGELEDAGVKTVICTDISKDGVLAGSNIELYSELSERFTMDFIASGGVSAVEEVRELAKMGLYGAILGKAIYTGGIDLREAISAAKETGDQGGAVL